MPEPPTAVIPAANRPATGQEVAVAVPRKPGRVSMSRPATRHSTGRIAALGVPSMSCADLHLPGVHHRGCAAHRAGAAARVRGAGR
jgi:hypothetical protein